MKAWGGFPVESAKTDLKMGNVEVAARRSAEMADVVVRLADDLDVSGQLKQLAQAPAHDLVIVEQEYGDRHGA